MKQVQTISPQIAYWPHLRAAVMGYWAHWPQLDTQVFVMLDGNDVSPCQMGCASVGLTMPHLHLDPPSWGFVISPWNGVILVPKVVPRGDSRSVQRSGKGLFDRLYN